MTDETDVETTEQVPEEPAESAPSGPPPIVIPIVALAAMLVLVFFTSRIFLAVGATSKNLAALIALFLSANILIGSALLAGARRVRGRRPAAYPMLVLAGVLIVAAGATATAIGGGEEDEHAGGGGEDGGQAAAVHIVAEGIAFTEEEVEVPAGREFAIEFENRDAGTPHNISIWPGDGPEGEALFVGEVFNGVETRQYSVPALEEGSYFFQCDVHPQTMTGTMNAAPGGGGGDGGTDGGTGGGETVVAQNIAFEPTEVSVSPEDGQVTLTFDNRDQGVPHNIAVFEGEDSTAPKLFEGEIITGPDTIDYTFEAPDPGEYFFWCDVHPTMTGTLRIE